MIREGKKIYFFHKLYLAFVILAGIAENALSEGNRTLHSGIQETCYVEDNYVLLYKMINWWNDSSPEDDTLLCGNRIRCLSSKSVTSEYNAAEKRLSFEVAGDFGELISPLKQCDRCFGPSYFQCTRLNEKYFPEMSCAEIEVLRGNINQVSIQNISGNLAANFKSVEKNLVFVVEGRIGGLLLTDGRIALHTSGSFLKTCSESFAEESNKIPISLTINDINAGAVVARFEAVYDSI